MHGHHNMMTTDMTLGMVFIAALIASVHCIGMCGPLVALAETVRPGKWRPWAQIPLNLGRVVTYSIMGAIAGLIGKAVERGGLIWDFQGGAALVGGVLMVLFAAVTAGWIKVPWAVKVSDTAVHRFTKALATDHPLGGFTLGLYWGLLPCGLVWAFLATAGAQASLIRGALVMALFGAGTVPAMLVMGGVGSLLGPRLRQWLPRIATVSILFLGVLMILRGASSAGWIGKVFIAEGVPLY